MGIENLTLNNKAEESSGFKDYRLGSLENHLEAKEIEKMESYLENEILQKMSDAASEEWTNFDIRYDSRNQTYQGSTINLKSGEKQDYVNFCPRFSFISKESQKKSFYKREVEKAFLFEVKDFENFKDLIKHNGMEMRDWGFDNKESRVDYELGCLGEALVKLSKNNLIIFKNFALHKVFEDNPEVYKYQGEKTDVIRIIKDSEEIKRALEEEIKRVSEDEIPKLEAQITELDEQVKRDKKLIKKFDV